MTLRILADLALGPWRAETVTAIQAARAAGAAILAIAQSGDLGTGDKADNSPVTLADLAADGVITRLLAHRFPADALLTEEQADNPARLAAPRVWLVDPLDGTREFVAGIPEYCVLIALAVPGPVGYAPAIGVVHVPQRGETLFAVRGHGAYRLDAMGLARIRVSNEAELLRFKLVKSRFNPGPVEKAAHQQLQFVHPPKDMGSALKAAAVATGDADVYIRGRGRIYEWDVAAGDILVTEAGGTVTDVDGAALAYNRPQPWFLRGVISSNGRIHDELVHRVRPVFERLREAGAP